MLKVLFELEGLPTVNVRALEFSIWQLFSPIKDESRLHEFECEF
jgi:hypothetical protein